MSHSLAQLALYRSSLKKAGIDYAGRSDNELKELYNRLPLLGGGLNNAAPSVFSEPAPEIEPVGKMIEERERLNVTKESAADQLQAALSALLKPQEQALDESRIIELIKQHGRAPETIHISNPETQKTVSVDSPHPDLKKILKFAALRSHVFLYGGAGTGKTTLAQQVAESLELDFYSTGAVMQKYELLGFIDATGNYQTTEFRKAYENGGVFLFDEFDACMPAAIVAFNQALDNGLCPFPDGMVKIHPDFVCIAAGNTIGTGANRQYIGRNPLDGASLDRFYRIEIPYHETLERRIAENAFKRAGGIDADWAMVEDFIEIVRSVRSQCESNRWPIVVSTRMTRRCAEMVALGFRRRDIIKTAIHVDFSEDQKRALVI